MYVYLTLNHGIIVYPSTKASQPSGDAWGLQTSKEAPMIASAMQPWQIHLGARISLILHQDDAVMFVNIVPTKLEQLLKRSPKEGVPTDPQDGIWGKESCLNLHAKRYKESA